MTDRPGDPREGTRLSGVTRVGLCLLAAFLVLLLVVARRLEPDPKGFGTHTQLGLAPCHFLAVTGKPCPSCGMTTSFAWLTRGQLRRSWGANPAGSILALVFASIVPWLLAVAAVGRPLGFRTLDTPMLGLAISVVGLSLLFWTVRLLLGRVS